MTILEDERYRQAIRKVVETKLAMDHLQAQLDEAEGAWHLACQELDALEDKPYPQS